MFGNSGFGGQNNNTGRTFGQSGSSGFFGSTNTSSGGSVFGQNPQNGGGGLFGAAASTPVSTGGMFGQQQQPAQSGGLFGNQQQQTGGGLFGSSQPQGSGIFSSSAQQTGNSGGGLFGSSNMGAFGNQQQATGGGFGSSATNNQGSAGGMMGQQSTGGGFFGNANTNTGGGFFGSNSSTLQSNTSPFGMQQSNTNTSGGFFNNNQQQGSGGLFGGAQQQRTGNALFGQTQQTNSLFGGNTMAMSSGGFGGSQLEPHRFKPYDYADGRLMSIMTTEVGDKNLNEIRWEFYQKNVAGLNSIVSTQQTSTSTLGNTATQQTSSGGLFGSFGGSGGGGGVGGSLFQNNNQTQTPANSLFGGGAQRNQQQQQTSTSGGLFGSSTTSSGFGTGGGLFGNKPTTQPSTSGFGVNTTATATTMSTGGLFGQTTNAFGSTPGTTNTGGGLFGAAKPQQTGTGLFGSTQQTTGQTGLTASTGLFGSATSQSAQQQQGTGGGLFGSLGTNAAAGTSSSTGGLFGNTGEKTQQTGGLFGSSTTGGLFGAKTGTGGGGTTSTGGLFGNTTSAGAGGLFGNKPATSGGGLFGSSGTSGGLFGTTAPSSNTQGGLFGSANSTSTGTGGLFGTGNTGVTANQSTSGGLFGSATGIGGNSLTTQGATNQQQLAPGTLEDMLRLGSLVSGGKLTVCVTLSANKCAVADNNACEGIVVRNLDMGAWSVGRSNSWSVACTSVGTNRRYRVARNQRALPSTSSLGGNSVAGRSGAALGPEWGSLVDKGQSICNGGVPDNKSSSNADGSTDGTWLVGTILKSAKERELLSSTELDSLRSLWANRPGQTPDFVLPEASAGKDIEIGGVGRDSPGIRMVESDDQSRLVDCLKVIASAVASATLKEDGKKGSYGYKQRADDSEENVSTPPNGNGCSNKFGVAPSELLPVLTNSEYWTVPTIQSLRAMSETQLAKVQDFIIGRRGKGKIIFPGFVDLRGIDLDRVVYIGHLEVSVYGDDSPPVGTCLNRNATVYLRNCCPPKSGSKTNKGRTYGAVDVCREGEEDVDAETLLYNKHKEKLKKHTEAMGAKFISLDPVTWEWVFEVDHFSRYRVTVEDIQSDADNDDDGREFTEKKSEDVEINVGRKNLEFPSIKPFVQDSENKMLDSNYRIDLGESREVNMGRGGAASQDVSTFVMGSVAHGRELDDDTNKRVMDKTVCVILKTAINGHESRPYHPNVIRHPAFPVRCAVAFSRRGFGVLPAFKKSPKVLESDSLDESGTPAARNGYSDRDEPTYKKKGSYMLQMRNVDALLGDGKSYRGEFEHIPYVTFADKARKLTLRTGAGSRGDIWTAGEVFPQLEELSAFSAHPTNVSDALTNGGIQYVLSCDESKDGWFKTNHGNEGLNMQEPCRHLFRSNGFPGPLVFSPTGKCVQRHLAPGTMISALLVLLRCLNHACNTEECVDTREHFKNTCLPAGCDFLDRFLLSMLDFFQCQAEMYGGESGTSPETFSDVCAGNDIIRKCGISDIKSSIIRISQLENCRGQSDCYLSVSYLSPYMAQTWRLMVCLFLEPEYSLKLKLMELLKRNARTKAVSPSLEAILERRVQEKVLDWLSKECTSSLLSHIYCMSLKSAKQWDISMHYMFRNQPQSVWGFGSDVCNTTESRRWRLIFHLLSAGQSAAAIEWLLKEGAFYPHLALCVAAHSQQQVGRQLIYLASLKADGMPHPPDHIRKIYRLLGVCSAPLLEESGSDVFEQKQKRRKKAEESLHAATSNSAKVDVNASFGMDISDRSLSVNFNGNGSACKEDLNEVNYAYGEASISELEAEENDLPFGEWHSELCASMFYSREGKCTDMSTVLFCEELRPPPQSADAPRDLKRALSLISRYGRKKREPADWPAAPFPLYVRHVLKQQKKHEQDVLMGEDELKELNSGPMDAQYNLLRIHAGLDAVSMAAVEPATFTPYPMDYFFSWMCGVVIVFHTYNTLLQRYKNVLESNGGIHKSEWIPRYSMLSKFPMGHDRTNFKNLLVQFQRISNAFSEQLENQKSFEMSFLVLLLSPSGSSAFPVIREIIQRNGYFFADDASVERRAWTNDIIIRHIGIPRIWLLKSKALFLKTQGRYLQAALIYYAASECTYGEPIGVLGSPAFEKVWEELDICFPLEKERHEILLHLASCLTIALPEYLLEIVLLLLQQRKSNLLGFRSSGGEYSQKNDLKKFLSSIGQLEFNNQNVNLLDIDCSLMLLRRVTTAAVNCVNIAVDSEKEVFAIAEFKLNFLHKSIEWIFIQNQYHEFGSVEDLPINSSELTEEINLLMKDKNNSKQDLAFFLHMKCALTSLLISKNDSGNGTWKANKVSSGHQIYDSIFA